MSELFNYGLNDLIAAAIVYPFLLWALILTNRAEKAGKKRRDEIIAQQESDQ